MTIYNSPEDYGLQQVACIDYSSGDYCFDYRVVWKRLADGKLLSARDSGCSCPSPFEDIGMKDLQEVESTGWLKEEIAKDGQSYLSAADASAFLQKVEEALEALESHKKKPPERKTVKKAEKKDEARHDISWRTAATCHLEAAAYQITQALQALKNENDYNGQIHGHSALKEVSEALGDIAAAIERKPK
jgi:hypothetical protein